MSRVAVRVALLIMVVSLAVSAFAKPKSQNITLLHEASLNGTSLPAGDYVVRYDPDGPTTEVKFMQGKKEVASATGQVKTLSKGPQSNQVILNNASQVPSISEIDFSGKTTAISFDSSTMPMGK